MTTENNINNEINTATNNAVITNIEPATNNNDASFDLSKYYPDDLKSDPDFDRITKQFPQDPKALVKDYYNKFKHFGKARDVVKAELEAEFNKPVEYKEEEYNYELPENYTIEDEILTTAKLKAKELGIKPEQAKAFMSEIFKADQEILAKQEEAKKLEEKTAHEQNQKAIDQLKESWGYDYEKRLEIAEKTFAKFTSPEESVYFASLPIQAKIPLIKMMDSINSRISEGAIGRNESAKDTIASINAEIEKIDKDPSIPDFLKYNKKNELYQKKYLLEKNT